MQDLNLILKAHGLYITHPRLMILKAIFQRAAVFDRNDLMASCKERLDRVTIWRTLDLFYKHKILLKVPSSDGVIRYALSGTKAKEISVGQVSKQHSRLELICQDCGKIISIPDFKLALTDLPEGFEPLYIDTIVNGKCSTCAKMIK
jgi:Fur family transcriptional regulator, ferric uptake regulator